MWPTQEGDHSDVQLLQSVGQRFTGAQAAPAHGQALGAVGHQLVLLGEMGDCDLSVEVGRVVQLEQSMGV